VGAGAYLDRWGLDYYGANGEDLKIQSSMDPEGDPGVRVLEVGSVDEEESLAWIAGQRWRDQVVVVGVSEAVVVADVAAVVVAVVAVAVVAVVVAAVVVAVVAAAVVADEVAVVAVGDVGVVVAAIVSDGEVERSYDETLSPRSFLTQSVLSRDVFSSLGNVCTSQNQLIEA